MIRHATKTCGNQEYLGFQFNQSDYGGTKLPTHPCRFAWSCTSGFHLRLNQVVSFFQFFLFLTHGRADDPLTSPYPWAGSTSKAIEHVFVQWLR